METSQPLSWFQMHHKEMYAKECMQNTDPTSLLFNILTYSTKVSLSVRITQWLSWTAEAWALPAQPWAGVMGPCPVPSVPFSQGSGLCLGSGSHSCTRAGHSSQPQRGCLSGRAHSTAPSSSVVPLFLDGKQSPAETPACLPRKINKQF